MTEDTRLSPPLNGPFIASHQSSGRGEFIQVVISGGQAGTLVIVPHGLGRIPQMLLLLDAGNLAYPGFQWPITYRTTTQIKVQFASAGTYLIWLN